MQQLQSGALDMGFIQAAELVRASAYRRDQRALHRALDAVGRKVRPPSRGDQAVRGAAAGNRTDRIRLGHHRHARHLLGEGFDRLADIKGMKLRINPTPVYRDFYSSLGAAPTPIPTPQVFDAMANGQVDGLEADLEFSWNQRFDKVAKVILQMNAVFMPMAAVVSGRVWQSLPAADRELITKTVKSTLDARSTNWPAISPNWSRTSRTRRSRSVRSRPAIPRPSLPSLTDLAPKAPVLAELRKVGATL